MDNLLVKVILKTLLTIIFIICYLFSVMLCFLLSLFVGGSILHPEMNLQKPFEELPPIMTETEAIITATIVVCILMVELYFMLRALRFSKYVQITILVVALIFNIYCWADLGMALCSESYLRVLFNRLF